MKLPLINLLAVVVVLLRLVSLAMLEEGESSSDEEFYIPGASPLPVLSGSKRSNGDNEIEQSESVSPLVTAGSVSAADSSNLETNDKPAVSKRRRVATSSTLVLSNRSEGSLVSQGPSDLSPATALQGITLNSPKGVSKTNKSAAARRRVKKGGAVTLEIPDITIDVEVIPSAFSATAADATTSAFDKTELLTLISGKNTEYFRERIDAIPVETIPLEVTNELIIDCIENAKWSILKYLISKGYRMKLDPPAIEVVSAYHKLMVEGKYDSLTETLLDTDPVGTIKLIHQSHLNFSQSKMLEKFKKSLQKSGISLDPEAVQLAAETAADLKALEIFQIIYESDLMVRMIPSSKLLEMFTCPTESFEEYSYLLHRIINERKLVAPFKMNILSLAAMEGKYEFLDVVEPHLKIFTWDIVLQAICFALKAGKLSFAEILLRTNKYSKCENLHRLVKIDEFIRVVAKYANQEIIHRIYHAVYQGENVMLLSDLSLTKIFLQAAREGNIEVVEYFCVNGIFYLGTRFGGRSVFRIALESKQFDLARYMIRVLNYDINDSDTPTINHPDFGGDSLIYVAENSSIEMFSYLLRLGANPNVQVLDSNGRLIPLVYWCIAKGQDLLVKELLKHKCQIDRHFAIKMNSNVEKRDKISQILAEAFPQAA